MVTAMLAAMPLAAGLDWLEGLLPVLFVLFWIGSQIVNAVQQANRRRPPPAVRPVRPAPAPPRAEEIHAELERQIDEFLRRPAERRPQRADAGPVGRPPRRPARQAPPPLPVVVQPPANDRGAAAGSAVARHVHDAFAHELEHLSTKLATAVPAAAEPGRPAAVAPAAELVAALRSPATLRQLILLREVLERPVDRW